MIQNESLPVWHYGRGRALTTGRITYTGGDPADLASYRIEGALKWTRIADPAGIVWRAQLDADGITPIVYASADLLSSTAGSEDIQAMVITFDGDVSTGEPAHVDATLRDLTDPETGTDLAEDQALCITVIVSQIGPPQYSQVPFIGAPPLPPGPPERIIL